MKNLGAGIATSGGYVVGRKDLIYMVGERLTAPCVGKDMGANFNQLLPYFKGLFMAPSVVASVLKTMTFASKLLEKLGFRREGLYKEFISFVNDKQGNPVYENTYEYAVLKKEWSQK